MREVNQHNIMNISGVHAVIYLFRVVSKYSLIGVVIEIHVKSSKIAVTSNLSKPFRCNLSVTYITADPKKDLK